MSGVLGPWVLGGERGSQGLPETLVTLLSRACFCPCAAEHQETGKLPTGGEQAAFQMHSCNMNPVSY